MAVKGSVTDTPDQILAAAREATDKMLDFSDKATAASLKAIKTVASFGPEALRSPMMKAMPLSETRQLFEAGFDLFQGLASRQRAFVLDVMEAFTPAAPAPAPAAPSAKIS